MFQKIPEKLERVIYLILLFVCAITIFYLYRSNNEIRSDLTKIGMQEELDELLSHKLIIEIIDLYHADRLTKDDTFDLLTNYYIIDAGCNVIKDKKGKYMLTNTKELTEERILYTLCFLSEDYNFYIQEIGSLCFYDKIEEINRNAFYEGVCKVNTLILPDFNDNSS